MESTITTTIPFFSLIACGYLAGRMKVLSAEGMDGINAFVFYFSLPVLLFRTMATRPLDEIFDPSFVGAFCVG